MPRDGSRGRLRSYEACLNCRRKKTRCPAERPVCSNCARLNQSCLYISGHRASYGQSEDRLASLEEKVNFIMKGSRSHDESNEALDPSPTASTNESSTILNDLFAPELNTEDPSLHISSPRVAEAIELYFQYCHRQPIWCFNYEDLEGMGFLPKELVYSILALTSRFSWTARVQDQMPLFSSTTRTLIMLHVASGTVSLETIESLCLLSYAFFMDGNVHLGQFHLGLAFQVCSSARIDVEAAVPDCDPLAQRKKRIFWSLLLLEQSYGQRPNGRLRVFTEVLCPCCVPSIGHEDNMSGNDMVISDSDIWSLAVHFGWVWSKVRVYVSDCARDKLKEPWRHDSVYAVILSELTEAENKLSQCHRYDSVRFYDRKADEVRVNQAYWGPWLKLQFTYHCILTILNHPFLYIVASQHNPNLAIPNAFWRRSSELALLHATWLVRMVDMVSDKTVRLTDPFFGHAAAVAATVHLYFCRAANPRLKFKSKTDLAKCQKFLGGFVSFSPACHTLDQALEKVVLIAFGPENVSHDWTPSRIYLSVSLMWDVLRANCTPESQSQQYTNTGLLHPSLNPTTNREDQDSSQSSSSFSSTLEIIVAMSPEVTVNTADGGQAAHMPPRVRSRGEQSTTSTTPAPHVQSPGGTSNIDLGGEKLVVPNDNPMLNTPWLWTDPAQFVDPSAEQLEDDMGGFFSWWDLGNL